jgi:hypothetical protein
MQSSVKQRVGSEPFYTGMCASATRVPLIVEADPKLSNAPTSMQRGKNQARALLGLMGRIEFTQWIWNGGPRQTLSLFGKKPSHFCHPFPFPMNARLRRAQWLGLHSDVDETRYHDNKFT